MSVKHSNNPSGPLAFCDLLRGLRKAKKLGLVELANASGFDPGLLSRIETGKRLPPDKTGLLRLAKALAIPEESSQFGELLVAAGQVRNPGIAELVIALSDPQLMNRFSAGMRDRFSAGMKEEPPVFCETLAELVSKATERAITTDAQSITVKSASGAIQKFQLLWDAKSKKKRSS